MDERTLEIVLRARDEASKNIEGAAGRIQNSFRDTEEASKKFALGLLGVGTAAAGFIGYGAKIAGDLEASRQGFITLLGSASKADAAIAQVKKDAAATPFELPGLVQANQLLTSVTKDAGRSETLLMNVGKALAAMGKGQPELDRIIVNLQQIGSVGHASMIDIKQFAFAGIPIFDMLKQKLKETTVATVDNTKKIDDHNTALKRLQGQLAVAEQRQKEFNDKTKESTKLATQNSIDTYRAKIASLSGEVGKLTSEHGKLVSSQNNLDDAIKDGKVTFELLEDMFNKAGAKGGQFENAFKNQAGTFNQLLSNMHDSFNIFLADVVQSTGAFDTLKGAMTTIINFMNEHGKDIGAEIIRFISFVKENAPIIAGVIIGGLTPAMYGFATAVGIATVNLLPFLYLGLAVGWLAKTIIDNWTPISQFFINTWATVSAATQAAVQWVSWQLIMLIVNLANMEDKARLILANIGRFFINLGSTVTGIVGGIISDIKNMVNSIIDHINGLISRVNGVGSKIGLGSIKIPSIPRFADGGWVHETGLAVVHKNEYVMSEDELRGHPRSDSPVRNNYNQPVNIFATINTPVDLKLFAYQIGYELRNR